MPALQTSGQTSGFREYRVYHIPSTILRDNEQSFRENQSYTSHRHRTYRRKRSHEEKRRHTGYAQRPASGQDPHLRAPPCPHQLAAAAVQLRRCGRGRTVRQPRSAGCRRRNHTRHQHVRHAVRRPVGGLQRSRGNSSGLERQGEGARHRAHLHGAGHRKRPGSCGDRHRGIERDSGPDFNSCRST